MKRISKRCARTKSSAHDYKMADKPQGKGRKRTHFEMERSRQSPFQNPARTGESAAVVSKAPRGINSAEFAESRALEIHNMLQALSSAAKQSNKRVFQSLPRHMRRRAASHNSKRIPVRLRDAYDREVGKDCCYPCKYIPMFTFYWRTSLTVNVICNNQITVNALKTLFLRVKRKRR